MNPTQPNGSESAGSVAKRSNSSRSGSVNGRRRTGSRSTPHFRTGSHQPVARLTPLNGVPSRLGEPRGATRELPAGRKPSAYGRSSRNPGSQLRSQRPPVPPGLTAIPRGRSGSRSQARGTSELVTLANWSARASPAVKPDQKELRSPSGHQVILLRRETS